MLIVMPVYIRMVVTILPMPHMSQRTISFGLSESSFLHLMHIISVVVSSTVREEGGGRGREKRKREKLSYYSRHSLAHFKQARLLNSSMHKPSKLTLISLE